MSQSLWDRFESRTSAVVERTLQAYVSASPHYEDRVPQHLHRHMAHTCRSAVRLFARVARQDRDPREDELRLFRERGQERGAEGLPVTDLVHSYLVLAEVLWDELARTAGGAPPPAAAGALLRLLQRVVPEAVQGHQQEFRIAHGEEREAVRAVVQALAAGAPAAERAARSGVRIAEAYAVVALRFAPHPTEFVGDAVGRRLAGRRKVHQLSEQLHRALSDEALAELEPDGGLVLLPSAPGMAQQDIAAVRAAVPHLQQAGGVEVMAGFAHADEVAEVPTATARARRLAQLARNPGQVAVLDEHLLEYQLHHDSDAVPPLMSMVEELRAEPDLMATVTAYFANDFNRAGTARELHVHPNTIDNRLARISSLTGANPRTARGLMVLGAALSVSTGIARDRE